MEFSLYINGFDLQITIFDSESEDQMVPDTAILTATLKGTSFSPLRCDSDILYRQHVIKL